MKPDYNDFTDFLKDNRFLRWQMNPDEQLNEYWKKFQEENPHLKGDIINAKGYLKDTVLNKSTLSAPDRIKMLQKIESEIKQNRKKSKNRLLLYISAFSAAAVVLLVVSLKIFNSNNLEIPASTSEVIVGNLLNDTDIQLVTDDRTVSFAEDVQVEFDSEGNAKIVQANNVESETVDVVKSKSNKLIVPFGKRSTLTLADGSKVWLNSGSVLEFPAQFDGKTREINLLSGEIYLEVVEDKQKPFYVKNSEMSVRVYGTTFNVSNYAGSQPSVVLIDGSVSVQAQDIGEMMLQPSEQAILSENGSFQKHTVNIEEFVSWKNGYLIFDKVPLTEVLRQVERYYNLSINLDQSTRIGQITCEGKLILSENIDNVMNAVAILSGAVYQREDNTIYLIKNNSN